MWSAQSKVELHVTYQTQKRVERRPNNYVVAVALASVIHVLSGSEEDGRLLKNLMNPRLDKKSAAPGKRS